METQTDSHSTRNLERFIPIPGWDLSCAFFDQLSGFGRIIALSELADTNIPEGMRLVSAVPFDPSRPDVIEKRNRIDSVLRGHLLEQHEFLRLEQGILEHARDQGEIFPALNPHGRYSHVFISGIDQDVLTAFELRRQLDGD